MKQTDIIAHSILFVINRYIVEDGISTNLQITGVTRLK